jgi:hypothetical protein
VLRKSKSAQSSSPSQHVEQWQKRPYETRIRPPPDRPSAGHPPRHSLTLGGRIGKSRRAGVRGRASPAPAYTCTLHQSICTN